MLLETVLMQLLMAEIQNLLVICYIYADATKPGLIGTHRQSYLMRKKGTRANP